MPENRIEHITESDNPQLDAEMLSYGKKIYAHLLERCENRDVARETLRQVMLKMYRSVRTTGCSNPLEALLYVCAEEKQNDILNKSADSIVGELIDNVTDDGSYTGTSVSAAEQDRTITEKPIEQVSADKASDAAFTEKEDGNRSERNGDKERPENDSLKSSEPSSAEQSSEFDEFPDIPSGLSQTIEKTQHHGSFGSILLIVLLLICIGLTIWIIIGLLMSIGIVPEYDLGYEWFNQNIYPLI